MDSRDLAHLSSVATCHINPVRANGALILMRQYDGRPEPLLSAMFCTRGPTWAATLPTVLMLMPFVDALKDHDTAWLVIAMA
jgi:hypothetical protein